MKKLLYTFALASAMLTTGCDNIEDVYQYDTGYPVNWYAAADSATTALVDYFWNSDNGYFNYISNQTDGDDYNYWPQAHAMDVIIDAYKRTGESKYSDMFGKWYTGILHKSGGTYYNNFYDDEQWITLTMLRLYEVTNEGKYLETASLLWDDIKGGWNTEYGGGGIAWTHDQPWAKNACSNGPAALLGCRFYEIRKDNNDLEWAKKIYEWQRDNLFNPATGAIYDGLNGSTGEINTVSLTYNQGTFMAAAHHLYKITGDAIYLKDARRTANYCISSLIDQSNNVLRDEGTGDNALFKGIFMRYFRDLINENDLDYSYRNKFTTFFNNNAEVLWSRGITDKRELLFSSDWTKGVELGGTTQLTAQTSAATMIEARAANAN